MKSEDPLISAWEATLARKASTPAIFDTTGGVARTFADIEMRAKAFQAEMQGRVRGEIHALDLGNDPDWPSVFLACLRTGLVALPLEDASAAAQSETLTKFVRPGGWGENVPVLLKLTSGTTAAPRAIRFRSAQLLADCAQICETMGMTEADLNFGVIPVSHSYGFSNLITPLLARGVPLVLSRDRMPRAVLNDLARTRATVFPGMPVFYQAFAQMESVVALPNLRLAISAGAPLPLAVAQKFRAQFGQPIHSFYGSSECGGICYDRAAELVEEGFVGRPLQDVRVRLLEPENAMSRIEVHSAAAGDGYFPVPEDEKLSGGKFRPDDLLASAPNGYRITGRVSDVINVAGRKVNPAEVEAVLLACAGVREAAVFGRVSVLRNEEVAACVVAEKGVSETELLAFCRRRLSGWQAPKRIFFLPEIPLTERGKVSRRALTARFTA